MTPVNFYLSKVTKYLTPLELKCLGILFPKDGEKNPNWIQSMVAVAGLLHTSVGCVGHAKSVVVKPELSL